MFSSAKKKTSPACHQHRKGFHLYIKVCVLLLHLARHSRPFAINQRQGKPNQKEHREEDIAV